MVFKKKGTDEKIELKSPEEPKKEESKIEEKPEEKKEEELTVEDVLVNHEKRIAHLESVLLQLRNSI